MVIFLPSELPGKPKDGDFLKSKTRKKNKNKTKSKHEAKHNVISIA